VNNRCEIEGEKLKKHLIVIGIIVLLLAVGLSGCEESISNVGITNIGDITANPEDYYGKEVTIEGSCMSNLILDDSEHSMEYKYHTTLLGLYRVTGIIKHEQGVLFDYFLDVTNVKAL